jgi:integrase/recombinase XerC
VTSGLPSPAESSAFAVVVHAPGGVSMAMPPVISDAGEDAARFTLEVFTARIPNPPTRKAYGRAVLRFCVWCQARGVSLRQLAPTTLATYLEDRQAAVSTASVKLAASAVRHWLDYLTERGALPSNPARSVRTVRLVVTEGKTRAGRGSR